MKPTLEQYNRAIEMAGDSGDMDSVRELHQAYLNDYGSRPQTALEAVSNGGAAAVAGLVGMPMKALADVTDLAKAGVGVGYGELSGKAPPAWLDPMHREDVPLTPEWNAKQIDKMGGDTHLDPNTNTLNKALYYGTGAVVGASPASATASLPQAALNVAGSFGAGSLSGLGAEQIQKLPGDSSGAQANKNLAAALLPAVMTPATVNSAKNLAAALIAGDRRQEINTALQQAGQRGGLPVETYRQLYPNADPNAPDGVPLSMGQASGSPMLSSAENFLSKMPVGGSRFQDLAEAQQGAMQDRLNTMAHSIDPNRGSHELVDASGVPLPDVTRAGTALANGLTNLKDNIQKPREDALKRQFEQKMSPDTFIDIPASIARARQLQTPHPNDAEIVNEYLNQPAVKSATNTILEASKPTPSRQILSSVLDENGQPYVTGVEPGKRQGMSFQAVRDIRRNIGEDAFKPQGMYASSDQGRLQGLYGPLKEDLRNAAEAHGAGDEWQVLQETIAKNRQLAERLDAYQNKTPEEATRQYQQDFLHNQSRFGEVNQALTPDYVAPAKAEVLAGLGKATPGQQNAEGDKFSIARFQTMAADKLKNDPYAFERLLNQTPVNVEQLTPLLKTGERIKDSAKWLANPSGTGHAVAALQTAQTAGEALTGNASAAAKLGGALLGMTQLPKYLTSQSAVERLAAGKQLTDQQKLLAALLVAQPQTQKSAN